MARRTVIEPLKLPSPGQLSGSSILRPQSQPSPTRSVPKPRRAPLDDSSSVGNAQILSSILQGVGQVATQVISDKHAQTLRDQEQAQVDQQTEAMQNFMLLLEDEVKQYEQGVQSGQIQRNDQGFASQTTQNILGFLGGTEFGRTILSSPQQTNQVWGFAQDAIGSVLGTPDQSQIEPGGYRMQLTTGSLGTELQLVSLEGDPVSALEGHAVRIAPDVVADLERQFNDGLIDENQMLQRFKDVVKMKADLDLAKMNAELQKLTEIPSSPEQAKNQFLGTAINSVNDLFTVYAGMITDKNFRGSHKNAAAKFSAAANSLVFKTDLLELANKLNVDVTKVTSDLRQYIQEQAKFIELSDPSLLLAEAATDAQHKAQIAYANLRERTMNLQLQIPDKTRFIIDNAQSLAVLNAFAPLLPNDTIDNINRALSTSQTRFENFQRALQTDLVPELIGTPQGREQALGMMNNLEEALEDWASGELKDSLDAAGLKASIESLQNNAVVLAEAPQELIELNKTWEKVRNHPNYKIFFDNADILYTPAFDKKAQEFLKNNGWWMNYGRTER